MHLWPQATYTPSPNCDQRPDSATVSLLVIHNISLPPGRFGGGHIHRFFQNCLDPDSHEYFQSICDMRVSAHLLIERDGRATQFVPFDQRAWHAGESIWQGEPRCNDYPVGIEMEGTDDLAYTDQQYAALVEVTRYLMKSYPLIRMDRIVGHSDIAPVRKTDPGPAFDWDGYRRRLEVE